MYKKHQQNDKLNRIGKGGRKIKSHKKEKFEVETCGVKKETNEGSLKKTN